MAAGVVQLHVAPIVHNNLHRAGFRVVAGCRLMHGGIQPLPAVDAGAGDAGIQVGAVPARVDGRTTPAEGVANAGFGDVHADAFADFDGFAVTDAHKITPFLPIEGIQPKVRCC